MTHLGWLGIVRLGLVQTAIGAVVVLTTSTLNRVMAVELALPAVLPAALVAWHYTVQLSRPRWGYGSDMGRRRTPWIIGGMGVLAMGALAATNAVALMASSPAMGTALAVLAFAMIGVGVAASGTSLLALLATRVAPERRPAAAAITWVMMIAGFILTTAVAGSLLDPFSFARLSTVAGGVALAAFLLAAVAVVGVERDAPVAEAAEVERPAFREVLAQIWAEPEARRFTIFVGLAMTAYSMQDLILEPFAGLVFDLSVGESTRLASVQNQGSLLGMILVGVTATTLARRNAGSLRRWTVGGCVGSALALAGLALGSASGPGWPLHANVFLLGFCNGAFAVAAIGSMMALAGHGAHGREGARMGLWGASQAIAMGFGGLIGAAGADLGRAAFGAAAPAFATVFAAEALLFLAAAALATRIHVPRAQGPEPAATPELTGGVHAPA